MNSCEIFGVILALAIGLGLSTLDSGPAQVSAASKVTAHQVRGNAPEAARLDAEAVRVLKLEAEGNCPNGRLPEGVRASTEACG